MRFWPWLILALIASSCEKERSSAGHRPGQVAQGEQIAEPSPSADATVRGQCHRGDMVACDLLLTRVRLLFDDEAYETVLTDLCARKVHPVFCSRGESILLLANHPDACLRGLGMACDGTYGLDDIEQLRTICIAGTSIAGCLGAGTGEPEIAVLLEKGKYRPQHKELTLELVRYLDDGGSLDHAACEKGEWLSCEDEALLAALKELPSLPLR